MKTTVLSGILFGLIATPAFAGNLGTPVMSEPVVAAPIAQAAPAGYDWGGFYAGAQLGYGDASATGGIEGDGIIGGVHAGYNYDFGQVVAGGELDYDFTDIALSGGAGTIDSVLRGKVKLGYDAGPTLIYATGGVARADTSNLGQDTGAVFGAGVDYLLTPSTIVGIEYLNHDFNDFDGSGVDVDVDTFRLKGSLRF